VLFRSAAVVARVVAPWGAVWRDRVVRRLMLALVGSQAGAWMYIVASAGWNRRPVRLARDVRGSGRGMGACAALGRWGGAPPAPLSPNRPPHSSGNGAGAALGLDRPDLDLRLPVRPAPHGDRGQQGGARVGARIVEVCPAAALNRWGLPSRGYKDPTVIARDLRAQLIGDFESRIPVTIPPEAKAAFIENDHCLDALICALVARAATVGLTEAPPTQDLETILREGWIELPTSGSVELLVSATGQS